MLGKEDLGQNPQHEELPFGQFKQCLVPITVNDPEGAVPDLLHPLPPHKNSSLLKFLLKAKL
jgi:hypothetical protein